VTAHPLARYIPLLIAGDEQRLRSGVYLAEEMERETGFEPATSTLATLSSALFS